MTEEILEPLYFKFKGKIARLLGRESVSNSIVALCEIVKNSWDADATDVSIAFENPESEKGLIRITDNGLGLNLRNFENTWMIVGTDDKEKRPFTEVYKRPKVGEKGIGRFATEKLSHQVKITSRPQNEVEGFSVEINWDEYEKGGLFNKIPNQVIKITKKKKEHGFEIILKNLRERWNSIKINEFQKTLELLLPPVKRFPCFKVKLIIGESQQRIKRIHNRFLSLAVYKIKSKLDLNGIMHLKFSVRGGKTKQLSSNVPSTKCGPVELDLYFFYRDKRGNYPDSVSLKNIKGTLNKFGGLHFYRDDFKVNLAGDWAGLDKLRVQDPSNYPGYNQIIGFLRISKKSNPDIIDTTTREGIVENEAWIDFKEYIYKAIDIFVENRKNIEGKSLIKKHRKVITRSVRIDTEELLAFSDSYPWVFYKPLEKEINACYSSKLFNACLMLSRKMTENLVFNLLQYKFPPNIELRWDTSKNRPLDFAVLIDNIEKNRSQFDQEELLYLDKFLIYAKPFKRNANSKAHNIIEYVEKKDEIDSLKISEMIQTLLILLQKIKK